MNQQSEKQEERRTAGLVPDDVPPQAKHRERYGDCALVEIIHLHDCLRGALKALESDVKEMSQVAVKGGRGDLEELERRVVGRFKVIWSVFRAHSSAEDEFIWPALQSKTQGRISHSPKYHPGMPAESPARANLPSSKVETSSVGNVIEQTEYEEDHADEERMFSTLDGLLAELRNGLMEEKRQRETPASPAQLNIEPSVPIPSQADTIHQMTKSLSKHLLEHLEKEEKQCIPLVAKHLNRSEIDELVGKIMGKRSSDTIAQILTMAVQNLNDHDREDMVKYMKQAMEGTFFDRWLLMSGWMTSTKTKNDSANDTTGEGKPRKRTLDETDLQMSSSVEPRSGQRAKTSESAITQGINCGSVANSYNFAKAGATSQAELEKLIRAVATNPALTPVQKNNTIQDLRDSVWKSNQRKSDEMSDGTVKTTTTWPGGACLPVGAAFIPPESLPQVHTLRSSVSSTATTTAMKTRRCTPPSRYYRKNNEGKIQLLWNSDSTTSSPNATTFNAVPLFSAAELAPTYHDGAAAAVLGCPHYARACKLRHPKSGRLYTCRLCCEQEREMPTKDCDESLDRYSVKEVMCMKCNTLQPAEDRCMNVDCESKDKPFAKYFCKICHLYDDRARAIFHCPYCNTCRMGRGLGIDFRHCMRCNACVSLSDDDHRCIPQKLQGSCPICRESMFQSTEPLRGLRCGHVMHLSCFTKYRRGHAYTCPLCMRSMEDMKDHFALLDAAVRMQPMPPSYLSTVSSIYCQDCGKTGEVQYHFVGQKCPHCGSYNTREMGRVHNSAAASSTQSRP